ncbi:hypothetical protein I7I48_04252 [Histoplasma ohiense]|nr:hypothetical protein I7I48_04252 [Histoplasma ohiense (nom. inval.)]
MKYFANLACPPCMPTTMQFRPCNVLIVLNPRCPSPLLGRSIFCEQFPPIPGSAIGLTGAVVKDTEQLLSGDEEIKRRKAPRPSSFNVLTIVDIKLRFSVLNPLHKRRIFQRFQVFTPQKKT